MSETRTEEFIPSADSVSTPTAGRQVWRFADGHICTGREQDGSRLTREKIVGRLLRVGIYFGDARDGTPYGQVEADVQTAEGPIRLKCGVTDKNGCLKPSVAALSFIEGLLEVGKDELFVATASQSTKPTRFGNFVTYANLFHLDPQTMRSTPVARRKHSADAHPTMDDRWDALERELKSHAAWADRPKGETDSDAAATHLSELCKECKAKGWPTPEQAPAEWLAIAAKFFREGKVRAALSSYTDDEWGQIRLPLQKRTEIPLGLVEAKKRLESQPAAADKSEDYDPFNDL